MTITEPSTMFTDYVLAAAALFWGMRLWRADASLATRLWALVFLSTAAAAVAGGTIHGFQLHLGDAAIAAQWAVVSAAIGAASFCLLATVSLTYASGWWRPLLVVFAGGKLLAIPLRAGADFRLVIYDYALSMLVVLVIAILVWRKTRAPAARWLMDGVLLSFVAAAVQQGGISLHEHFNHNDLYHVVQIAAFYLFYRGAMVPYARPPGPGIREPAKAERIGRVA